MTSGYARRDLGSINHDPAFVTARCEHDTIPGSSPACRTLRLLGAMPKARAIAAARVHAKRSGHEVVLTITHWQRVYPPREETPA